MHTLTKCDSRVTSLFFYNLNVVIQHGMRLRHSRTLNVTEMITSQAKTFMHHSIFAKHNTRGKVTHGPKERFRSSRGNKSL